MAAAASKDDGRTRVRLNTKDERPVCLPCLLDTHSHTHSWPLSTTSSSNRGAEEAHYSASTQFLLHLPLSSRLLSLASAASSLLFLLSVWLQWPVSWSEAALCTQCTIGMHSLTLTFTVGEGGGSSSSTLLGSATMSLISGIKNARSSSALQKGRQTEVTANQAPLLLLFIAPEMMKNVRQWQWHWQSRSCTGAVIRGFTVVRSGCF